MNVTTVDPEVRDYLEAVKRHLADLPEEELDDLTIDLESHLVEVSAEGSGSLADQLGPAAAYARELRATAGFGAVAPRRSGVGVLLDALSDQVGSWADTRGFRKAEEWWGRARPMWVVLRGWLAITLWVVLWSNWIVFDQFPIPEFGSTAMGIVAVAAATWLSLHAARRAPASRRWRVADAAFTGAVAVLLLMSMTGGSAIGRNFPAAVDYGQVESDILAQYPLATARNVYPYDLDGNPLRGVLLYDQDGNPLDLHPWYAGDQEEIDFLEDRFGQPIKNAYPLDIQTLREYSENGNPIWEPEPAPRVPLPAVEPLPAAGRDESPAAPAEPSVEPSPPAPSEPEAVPVPSSRLTPR